MDNYHVERKMSKRQRAKAVRERKKYLRSLNKGKSPNTVHFTSVFIPTGRPLTDILNEYNPISVDPNHKYVMPYPPEYSYEPGYEYTF